MSRSIDEILRSLKKSFSNEEEEEYDFEDTTEKAEENELEEEIEEEEEYDEEADTEKTVEVEYEDLVERLKFDMEEEIMTRYGSALEELQETVKKLTEAVDLNADAVEQNQSEGEEMNKSLALLSVELEETKKKLNTLKTMRKSVSNAKVLDKNDIQDEVDIEELSNAQKAAILAEAMEAGNTTITVTDVSTAEMGGNLSENAVKVIKESLK